MKFPVIHAVFVANHSAMLRGLAVIWLIGVAACTPMSETEKEYLEAQKEKAEEQSAFREGMEQSGRQSEVISKVKEWKQEDGYTAEKFVQVRGDLESGEKMMDSWTAVEERDKVFKVSYTYLHIDEDYVKERRGYTWIYNENVDRISGPEPIKPKEVRSRKDKETMTRNLRSRDPWSLE